MLVFFTVLPHHYAAATLTLHMQCFRVLTAFIWATQLKHSFLV